MLSYKQTLALTRAFPERLRLHNELVIDAARPILWELHGMSIYTSPDEVYMGVLMHDCGKLFFPEELTGSGNQHEIAGYQWCIALGFSEPIAECCVVYERWRSGKKLSDTAYIVGLADKLWRGGRDGHFEEDFATRIAKAYDVDRWAASARLSGVFDKIADGGHERLERSRQ